MAPSFYHPDAVTITLRSTRPTNFQTRNITLRPDEPVNVGRSSRSEAKNLSATANNALFDCPVISRRHAEFELRLNKWTEEKYLIFIKDTGSMHGTSVNGLKLVPSKPFKLKEGDTIRLGESVNRADNNYDGVTVTLQHIANATTKTTPQVKSSQQGISVPSDSESDFDDEGDSDGGAAHTTPDGGNVKSVPQPQTGSSCSHSIMVDEDEDDDALFTRRAPAQLNFIPDTYADNSVMVAVSRGSIPNAANAPRASHLSLEFNEAFAAIDEGRDVQAALAAAETAPSADEDSEIDEDAMSHKWSDDDHLSEEAQDSDEHSESHEDFDRQSFLSEEFNMTDDVAVEDDEDDEGPEVMSSKLKRRPSNELGTLGKEKNNNVMSDATCEAAIPARPHYDPVRGFQMPASSTAYRPYATFFGAPAHDMFADSGHSTKWDVEPAPVLDGFHNTFLSPFQPLPTNIPAGMMSGPYDPTPTNYEQTYSFPPARPGSYTFDAPALHSFPSAHDVTGTDRLFPFSEPFSQATENPSKKRKATEISTSEPVISTQAPTNEEVSETVVSTDAVTTPSSEPQPKKRKIKQAHQKSILRTAVIEAGKYTAGAIIGGIGLVTILASPIGEALASC